MRATCSLLILLAAPATFAQPLTLPKQLVDEICSFIEDEDDLRIDAVRLKPKAYAALVARVRAARDRQALEAALQELAQVAADHMMLPVWMLSVRHWLGAHPELRALGAGLFPAKLKAQEVTLRPSGKKLLGVVVPMRQTTKYRTLAREVYKDPKFLDKLEGQSMFRLLTANGRALDCHGASERLWLHRSIASIKTVEVPFPARWPAERQRTRYDDAGQLLATGRWMRRDGTIAEETLRFAPRHVSSGGVIYVCEAHGVWCWQSPAWNPRTRQARLPWTARDRRELSLDPPPAPPRAPDWPKLRERIGALRMMHADLPWPEPFDPEPAVAARVEAQLDKLAPGADPRADLLRLRHALLYDRQLPALARRDPATFLALERLARAWLDGGSAAPLLKAAGDDLEALAAVVRRCPRAAAPASGQQDGRWLQLPRGYSFWRRYPLVAVLHTEGRFVMENALGWEKLAPLAERAVVIAPTYGSHGGAPRTHADDQDVLRHIKALVLASAVDPDRLLLTGISQGGAKTWHLAAGYPDRWTAAAPVAHGPVWVLRYGDDFRFPKLRNLQHLPLRCYVGGFEGLSTHYARLIERELAELEAPFTLTERPFYGHWSQAPTAYGPEMARWLLRQRRPAPARELSITAERDFCARNHWLQLLTPRRPSRGWAGRLGSYARGDMTGVRASFDAATIKLQAIKGRPGAVRLFWIPELMPLDEDGGITIQIRGKRKSIRWMPKRDPALMLREVRARGERSQLVWASIDVDW